MKIFNYKLNIILIFSVIFNSASSVVEKLSRLELLENCGGNYSGYQYTIVSPNYPNNYPENEDCIYTLHGSPQAKCNQIFHLRFIDFTLKHSHNCEQDYLEIGDRSVYCGSIVGVRHYSSVNNTLRLNFHSGKNGSGKGFKILVTTLPCSDVIETTTENQKNYWFAENFNSNHRTNELSKTTINTESETVNYKNLYPVYRPNQIKPNDEEISFHKTERSPSKSNNNFDHSNNWSEKGIEDPQLPIHNVNSWFNNKTASSKVPTYLFASSNNGDDEEWQKTHGDFNNGIKNNVDIVFPASPSTLVPPIHHHITFNKNIENNENHLMDPLDFNNSIGRNTGKLVLPIRPINIPPDIPYAPLPGFNTQIKTGEVLDNVGENNDCNGKPNIDGALHISGNTREILLPGNNYPSRVFPSRPNIYPATVYGVPGPIRPPTSQLTPIVPIDPNIIVDSEFIYSSQINPSGFVPSPNIDNVFPGIVPKYNPTVCQCCSNNYAFQRVLLTSPGFPSLSYLSSSYECIYTIVPSSADICQMQFNFKYFNYGNGDDLCSHGFIEIDGRRFCGCRTGLVVVSNVVNLVPKTIRVNYYGYPRTKFNGFLIEVIQKSCPSNYYPSLSRRKKGVNDEAEEKLDDVEDLSNNRTKRHLGYLYPKPHVPFKPVDEYFYQPDGLIPSGYATQRRCQALNVFHWTIAAKEIHFTGAQCITNIGGSLPPIGASGNYPIYPLPNDNPGVIVPGPSPTPIYPNPSDRPPFVGNCKLISAAEGFLSSPGYPNFYPNNVNLCYRFLRIPSSCKLQMSILDFDLENSPGCIKDYLLFSNQNSRYCGKSLTGTKTILEFSGNNVIDIRFSSDFYGSGRGYNIGFLQIPCKAVQ